MMIEVTVNGERYCIAGVEAGVVSAFVNLLSIETADPDETPPRSASLSVTGFTQGPSREPEDQTSVHWGDVNTMLSAGDEIVIRVLDDGQPDPANVTQMLPPLDDA